MRKIGFNAREWEILKGPEHDLCHPVVLSKVISDIHKGKLIAAMFAPPCFSFSPARDRTRVVRTKQYPWGSRIGSSELPLGTGKSTLQQVLAHSSVATPITAGSRAYASGRFLSV